MSARPKLTSHQAEVYRRIQARFRHAAYQRSGIPLSHIGSVGAVNKLHVKGYIVLEQSTPGPRGGERWVIRPVEEEKS
jgi:hypothetical protein